MERHPLSRAMRLGLFPLLLLTTSALAAPESQDPAASTAYQQLLAQSERIGDPEYDYRLGVAAMDSGHPAEAIIALQRVLALQPNHAQARAELARAYALSGDIDTAKAQFETVVGDPTIPDPVRQRFNNLIRGYEQTINGGGTQVTGYLDFQLGHDSNINAATSLTSITIPLFAWLGPGQIGAQSRAISDSTWDLTGGVSISHGLSRANRLFASVLANHHDNWDSKAFDQQSLTTTVGVAHTLPSRDVLSMSVQNQAFHMGGDSLRNANGLIAQWTHLMPANVAWSTTTQYMDLDYRVAGLPDARRYSLSTGISTPIWLASAQWGRELSKDKAFRADSFNYYGANAGWQRRVSDKGLFYTDIAFEHRRHLDDNFMFLKERRDNRLDVGVGYRHRLNAKWLLTGRLAWTQNRSNIDLYDFNRFTASAGIRYEF